METKPKVLLIDDCAVMCSFYVLFLAKQFETVTFTDPIEALEALANGLNPDVIVTDLNMPQLGGIELIKAVKTLTPTIPVLVVSSDEAKLSKKPSLAAGAKAYLSKPFHPADLSNAIQGVLHPESENMLFFNWKSLFQRTPSVA